MKKGTKIIITAMHYHCGEPATVVEERPNKYGQYHVTLDRYDDTDAYVYGNEFIIEK